MKIRVSNTPCVAAKQSETGYYQFDIKQGGLCDPLTWSDYKSNAYQGIPSRFPPGTKLMQHYKEVKPIKIDSSDVKVLKE